MKVFLSVLAAVLVAAGIIYIISGRQSPKETAQPISEGQQRMIDEATRANAARRSAHELVQSWDLTPEGVKKIIKHSDQKGGDQ